MEAFAGDLRQTGRKRKVYLQLEVISELADWRHLQKNKLKLFWQIGSIWRWQFLGLIQCLNEIIKTYQPGQKLADWRQMAGILICYIQ